MELIHDMNLYAAWKDVEESRNWQFNKDQKKP